MIAWLIAAGGLLLALVPCLIVVCRAGPMDGLVAMQLAGTIATLILVVLAQGLGRPALFDLALALALLSLPGMLIFAYFLERWL